MSHQVPRHLALLYASNETCDALIRFAFEKKHVLKVYVRNNHLSEAKARTSSHGPDETLISVHPESELTPEKLFLFDAVFVPSSQEKNAAGAERWGSDRWKSDKWRSDRVVRYDSEGLVMRGYRSPVGDGPVPEEIKAKQLERLDDVLRGDDRKHDVEIERIIHLMWIDGADRDRRSVPDKYQKNVAAWARFNPNYEVRVWYFDDVVKLIEKEYAQDVLQFFLGLKSVISMCDFSRFLVNYVHGGVYADLDFYCVRNLDGLLAGRQHYFCNELEEHSKDRRLFNGFFACKKKHPFVKGWIDQMMKNYHKYRTVEDVMTTTGPTAFNEYHKTNAIVEPVSMCQIAPYTNKRTIANECRNARDVYAYNYWNEGTGWGLNATGGSYGWWVLVVIIVLLIVAVGVFLLASFF